MYCWHTPIREFSLSPSDLQNDPTPCFGAGRRKGEEATRRLVATVRTSRRTGAARLRGGGRARVCSLAQLHGRLQQACPWASTKLGEEAARSSLTTPLPLFPQRGYGGSHRDTPPSTHHHGGGGGVGIHKEAPSSAAAPSKGAAAPLGQLDGCLLVSGGRWATARKSPRLPIASRPCEESRGRPGPVQREIPSSRHLFTSGRQGAVAALPAPHTKLTARSDSRHRRAEGAPLEGARRRRAVPPKSPRCRSGSAEGGVEGSGSVSAGSSRRCFLALAFSSTGPRGGGRRSVAKEGGPPVPSGPQGAEKNLPGKEADSAVLLPQVVVSTSLPLRARRRTPPTFQGPWALLALVRELPFLFWGRRGCYSAPVMLTWQQAPWSWGMTS